MTAKWTKVFLYVSSFQLTTPKSAAYAQEYRPKSDAANLDKRRREPGTGLTSDKKKARGELQNDGGSGEISHEFPPTRRPQKNTSCFTGARLAIFGRSARARATDSGSETLHVPTTTMGYYYYGFQTAQNRSCSVQGGLFATVI